jgi:sec-independent protein translocase protein TatB
VFGIDSEKLIILAVITALVLGPKRLPEYARKLAEWVRKFRAFADNAQAQLSEELGEEVDWRKLDPRQYDPRRIIRDALIEPLPSSGSGASNAAAMATEGPIRGHAAAVAAMAKQEELMANEPAPYDTEAT